MATSYRENFRSRNAADIYDMGAERHDPAADAYMRGRGPSDWAEDRHPADPWLGQEPRNELGMGELRPHTERPASGMGYDNQGAMPQQGMPVASRNAAYKSAAIRRKAFRAVKLARQLLGNKVSEQVIEDQACEFMALSDNTILASLGRVRAASQITEEVAPVATPAPAPVATPVVAAKPVAKKPVAKVTVKAEDKPEEAVEEATEEAVEEAVEEVEGVEEEVAEEEIPAEGVEDTSDIELEPEMGEDIIPDAPAMGEAPMSMEDEALGDLLGEDAIEMAAPGMMPDEMPQSDEILKSLYDSDTHQVLANARPKTASRQPAPAKKVAKKLGTVKVASARNDVSELANLWKSDPDVSDMFK
jgi:hypothetical protein